ncbi:MAG: PGPGW domain-containing protein [Aquisalimonadaceae bacterium]
MIDGIAEYQTLFWWLASLSVVVFFATLIIVPMMVVRIPADYFARSRRRTALWANRHPVVRGLLWIVRNTLGLILLLVGLAMLVLPGQGIITILVAIMLLDFPAKFRLERWIVERPPVLLSINWLRRRAGKPPLVVDP